jgi:serine beta-lactamase-like protein LACTB, mitochondrial
VEEPGKHFHYSTQGYTLVACVMQGASGEKYLDYMRANVILPAGMEHTQPDNRFTIIPYRTRFYRKTDSGTVQNADFLDSSYKIPGGGWLSSAEDMARFEVAILNDKLIKRSTRDLMWTPLKPSDGGEDTYGLGWSGGNDAGIATEGHSGGQQGTTTQILVAPQPRVAVVVLANMEHVDTGALAREILTILTGTSGPAEQK